MRATRQFLTKERYILPPHQLKATREAVRTSNGVLFTVLVMGALFIMLFKYSDIVGGMPK